MGLFSFIKGVGEKISARNSDLKQNMDSYKLGTDKVDVDVDGDKVILKGEVPDQAALEKAVLAVGNTSGVAQVDTSNLTVAGSQEKEPVFYTVKSGDNLWKIAEAHYGKGNGAKNNIIFEANRPMLTSPDKIYPGQVLRIPPLED